MKKAIIVLLSLFAFVTAGEKIHIPEPRVEHSALKPRQELKESIKPTFWIGAAFDALGAGLIAYGIYEDKNVKNYVNDLKYSDAKRAAKLRDFGYIAGGALLFTGISVYILF